MSQFPRPCLGTNGAGCTALTRNTGGRCDTCRRAWEQARGTSTERGYGPQHRALRAHWAPIVATGTVICRRPGCQQPIHPDEPWHLGHTEDRSSSAPEHRDCNVGHRPRQPARQSAQADTLPQQPLTMNVNTTNDANTTDVVRDCPF